MLKYWVCALAFGWSLLQVETSDCVANQPPTIESLKDTRPLDRQRVMIRSTADGSQQPSILILPAAQEVDASQKLPMLVSLHSWSADLNQRTLLEWMAADKGWVFLAPNFRGPNSRPEACGSELAQQDILDAVRWAIEEHNVDPKRVYLTGASGGGHMTLMMVGRHPQIWRAASAWVGISDLSAWHRRHRDGRYGKMMEACCLGAPGDSIEVDYQYAARSPLTYLAGGRKVAIDIAAGIHDGHSGSVPIRHSIWAFNRIAEANGTPVVNAQEMEALSKSSGRLQSPEPGDEGLDEAFGRRHYLRRRSDRARLTIFEGGHEGIAEAVMDWFQHHP